MTQLEDDEMLTKGQTFEKKTLMRSKETKQCSEAESEETKHGGRVIAEQWGRRQQPSH